MSLPIGFSGLGDRRVFGSEGAVGKLLQSGCGNSLDGGPIDGLKVISDLLAVAIGDILQAVA